MTGGWLCPTELDRQRAVDTSARVRQARLLGSAFVGVGLLVIAPLLNWWLLALFAISTLNMVTPADGAALSTPSATRPRAWPSRWRSSLSPR